MTRGKQDKLYRSFNKGLVTEAGFLTYPEDASTDELNTVIYRKGNRTRRFGIDYEPSSSAIPFSDLVTEVNVTTEYFWRTPGNNSSLNFLVVQIGHLLYFFDASLTPLSLGKKWFTVDLTTFASPTATSFNVKNTRVQMSGGKGLLFVAQEYIDPFVISYSAPVDSITTTRVYLLIRDFDGINDNLPNDAEPVSLSPEHHYNLLNQGWVTPGTSVTPTTGGSTPGTSPTYYVPWTGVKYNEYENIP